MAGYKTSELGIDKADELLFISSGQSTKTITVAPGTLDAGSDHGTDFLRAGLVLVPLTGGTYEGMYTVFSEDLSIAELQAALIAAINAGDEPVTATAGGAGEVIVTADAVNVPFTITVSSPDDVMSVVETTPADVGDEQVSTITIAGNGAGEYIVTINDEDHSVSNSVNGVSVSDNAVVLKNNVKIDSIEQATAAYVAGNFKTSRLIAANSFDWNRVQRLKRHAG
jgi:hypothetical protein